MKISLLACAAADSDSEASEERKKNEGRKVKDDGAAEVRPAEEPSFDFVAYAVAAARQAGGATPPEQPEPGPSNGVTSGAQVLQRKQIWNDHVQVLYSSFNTAILMQQRGLSP